MTMLMMLTSTDFIRCVLTRCEDMDAGGARRTGGQRARHARTATVGVPDRRLGLSPKNFVC